MATCQICNIIWEPADGALADSIQGLFILLSTCFQCFHSRGNTTSLSELVLFAARCWTHLFSWSKPAELAGRLGAGPRFFTGEKSSRDNFRLASGPGAGMDGLHV